MIRTIIGNVSNIWMVLLFYERFQSVSTFFVFIPVCKIIRSFSTFTIKTLLPPGKFNDFIRNPRLFSRRLDFLLGMNLWMHWRCRSLKAHQASLTLFSWRSSYQLIQWSSLHRLVRSAFEYWKNVPGRWIPHRFKWSAFDWLRDSSHHQIELLLFCGLKKGNISSF